VGNNTLRCEGCQRGHYAPPVGKCKLCEEDHYCIAGIRYECSEFSYSAAGSYDRSQCMCFGGFAPIFNHQQLELVKCASCQDFSATLANHPECLLNNKVYSVLRLPVYSYMDIFNHTDPSLTDFKTSLWKLFGDTVVAFVQERSTIANHSVRLHPTVFG